MSEVSDHIQLKHGIRQIIMIQLYVLVFLASMSFGRQLNTDEVI